MDRELEVKVLNIDLKEMEKKLIGIGAKLIDRETQINTLIDKNNYLHDELNSYLRIRESKSLITGETKITLTMKKSISKEEIRENIEINTDISDKESMLQILDDMEYKVIEEGYKERTSYEFNNIRFDLDRWDENTYPDPYMEIEVQNKDDLEYIVDLLEIPKENVTSQSIMGLRKKSRI